MFSRTVLVLFCLFCLIDLPGCLAPVGPADERPPVLTEPPDLCQVEVNPAEDIRADLHAAAERIEAATGCTVVESESGFPVHIGFEIVTQREYLSDCGATPVLQYSQPFEIVRPQAIELPAVPNKGCEAFSRQDTLVHELFHTFISYPGSINPEAHDGHAPHGVFQAHVMPGQNTIDEPTLNYVCSLVHCTAYQPEE